jgi:O-antigen/teichoic acid export membrane protein
VVYTAAIKGLERFDVASRLEISVKLIQVAACLGAAWLTRDLLIVLITLCGVTCAGGIVRGTVASRLVGSRFLMPGWSRDRAREVLSFGVWNFLMNIAGAIFQNADRVIIGTYLGASAVAYFSVCNQLAQQVHAVPAAAMAVLLPLMSRKMAGGAGTTDRIKRLSVLANVLIAAFLGVGLIVVGPWFLQWLMGAEFASHTSGILPWLTLGYFVLSLGVAPHYLLLGQGKARWVAVTNIAGGIGSLVCAMVLIPTAGILGAAWSRLAYGPALIVNYFQLFRKN